MSKISITLLSELIVSVPKADKCQSVEMGEFYKLLYKDCLSDECSISEIFIHSSITVVKLKYFYFLKWKEWIP